MYNEYLYTTHWELDENFAIKEPELGSFKIPYCAHLLPKQHANFSEFAQI